MYPKQLQSVPPPVQQVIVHYYLEPPWVKFASFAYAIEVAVLFLLLLTTQVILLNLASTIHLGQSSYLSVSTERVR